MKNISRRGVLIGGAAAGCAALPLVRSKPVRAAGRTIHMRLDYLYQGPNGGFIVAREKGFYNDVGLDVEVGPGKGGGNTAQLVASGAADFGFADGFVVGDGAAKGLNLKMIAAIYRRNPSAVISLTSSNIKTAKDLEGKTIGISAGGGTFQQWPGFTKGCGLNTDKLHMVNIDPAGLDPALITGRVDAIVAFAQSVVPAVEIQTSKKTSTLWFSDCNVNLISDGIIARNDLIKNDPDLVRTFVQASLKGFLYARSHPEETAEIVKKYDSNSNVAISQRQLELSFETWVTPNTAQKPIGWMSEEDWQMTIEGLKEFNGVTAPLTPEQLYTNEFIPTGAEFVPPQN